MAEGLLRHLGEDRFEVCSAGLKATSVRPEAVEAMSEMNIDIASQESKTLERFLQEPFDLVVTVCDGANEACPIFPDTGRRLHWSVDDPAAVEGSLEVRLAAFREARDDLQGRIVSELL
jgi:arsenate reductase